MKQNPAKAKTVTICTATSNDRTALRRGERPAGPRGARLRIKESIAWCMPSTMSNSTPNHDLPARACAVSRAASKVLATQLLVTEVERGNPWRAKIATQLQCHNNNSEGHSPGHVGVDPRNPR
jgi:hypothetical protein